MAGVNDIQPTSEPVDWDGTVFGNLLDIMTKMNEIKSIPYFPQ